MAKSGLWARAKSIILKGVPTADEMPELYLEHARRCMKNVERKCSSSASSSVQFNHGQCQYLANKLRQALYVADTSNLRTLYTSTRNSPAITVQGIETMKLLWRCAREVESFMESSHSNNWVQAAIVSSNTTTYVEKLDADLQFFVSLICNYNHTLESASVALLEYENSSTISAAVREIVSQDQRALLTILETVNTSSNSCNEESQLAQCLASRLRQNLSGSVELDCWKIQLKSLVPGQSLGSGSEGTVRKSIWMGEDVAEKLFQGADHASFRNEVQILAGLGHCNIVLLIGYAEDQNRCVIVMELMDRDLRSLMEDRLRQNDTLEVPFSDYETVDNHDASDS